MGFKTKRVCEHCGSSSCNGKEFKVHLKYEHYDKVDEHIKVCSSQVEKDIDWDFVIQYCKDKGVGGCGYHKFDIDNYAKVKGMKKAPRAYYYRYAVAHGCWDRFKAIPI